MYKTVGRHKHLNVFVSNIYSPIQSLSIMYKRLPSIQIQLKINLLIFFIYSINIYKHKKVFAPAKNPIPIPLKFAEFLDTMPPSMDYIYYTREVTGIHAVLTQTGHTKKIN